MHREHLARLIALARTALAAETPNLRPDEAIACWQAIQAGETQLDIARKGVTEAPTERITARGPTPGKP